MSDYIVSCMENGDLKSIRNYVQTLQSINEYVYEDDENLLTLLHLAVGLDSIHRERVIEVLVELRADVNCAGISDDVENVRPLHLASMWGYDLTLKLLLYEGADASLLDSNGLSAIDYASMFDNHLCVSLLLHYGSLNSTASAWSAIMNSSQSDDISESSFENCFTAVTLDMEKSMRNYRGSLAQHHLK